ncbi:hypothetical protein KIPB_002615 [Kipferlia bialata]|uniref:Uncharacterized protein n=1 Tax=Kipferlia bialata TaxID=797122 RepID=A0A391NUX6_9EUKA|nr:hypothetical protein KIPB_002615 [Kipferlia bialata]|eukprot:g2615.t1
MQTLAIGAGRGGQFDHLDALPAVKGLETNRPVSKQLPLSTRVHLALLSAEAVELSAAAVGVMLVGLINDGKDLLFTLFGATVLHEDVHLSGLWVFTFSYGLLLPFHWLTLAMFRLRQRGKETRGDVITTVIEAGCETISIAVESEGRDEEGTSGALCTEEPLPLSVELDAVSDTTEQSYVSTRDESKSEERKDSDSTAPDVRQRGVLLDTLIDTTPLTRGKEDTNVEEIPNVELYDSGTVVVQHIESKASVNIGFVLCLVLQNIMPLLFVGYTTLWVVNAPGQECR